MLSRSPAMTSATRQLLGGLTPRGFLRRHWQKKPLLVRGAIPGFRDPLPRSALLDLATEPEVESRLILEKGGQRPWQVIPGPQDPARLRRLIRLHFETLEANADMAEVVQVALRQGQKFFRGASAHEVSAYFELIGSVLEEGIAAGQFRSDVPVKVATKIFMREPRLYVGRIFRSGPVETVANDSHRAASEDAAYVLKPANVQYSSDPAPART